MSTRVTIRPLTRFWLALERLPGPAAVRDEWRWLVGDDLDLVRDLLVPDRELAASFPRPGTPHEPYRVVEHGPDDFVGVGEEGEEPVPLTRADLIIHRLEPSRLARRVASALGIEPDYRSVDDLAATCCVGHYRPTAGFAFPVYLTVQLEGREYRAAADALVSRTMGEFLLLSPTNRHVRPSGGPRLARDRTAAQLALADLIQLGAGDRWERTELADRRLAEFREWVLPMAEPTAPIFFATPAGATWSDVRVRFLDGHRVTVRAGAAAATLSYTQMGFSDGRDADPNTQWELLRQFALGHGTLTWDSPAASRHNQKRRETLAKSLKAFFRIDGDPIVPTAGRKGWRTAFVVESD